MSFSNSSSLGYLKLSNNAYPPELGSSEAAGFDLSSAYEYIIPPHGKELVKTDLSIQLPKGTYGRIAPRSGLAWKNFINVGAGVIDPDYTGNVCILLFNHSNEDFKINKGDKVAQLICELFVRPNLTELDNIKESDRGFKGFGSTGVKRFKIE